ncbi:site-specific integrase [Fusobacterium sp.]|uniref:tyrosine-type recombinase/integrase n=1 Tax=Fusobacterium sp. TaxID=68766 RepID=UPI0025B7C971|nr:site-specific integrase [Fusobacterium sp.]MCI7224238.1 site-specific integrase [Fusobacterium sp.]
MKSANGMGTITKMSGNRRKPWRLRGPRIFNEKKKKFERITLGFFETQKEAITYQLAYFTDNTDMLENTNIKLIKKKKEKGITFEQVYNLWNKGATLKKSTERNRRTHFKNSSKLHNMEIKNINGILLNNVFNSLNLSNGTLRNLRSFWKNLWDFAITNDFCSKNYATSLKLPAKDKEKGKRTAKRDRPFTSEEMEILWDNIYTDKRNIIDIILIMCYTGLRSNELLSLRPRDVNLKYRFLDIVNAKTQAGIRKVPISDKILPLIRKRLDFSKEKLFLSEDKRIYKYDNLDNHFRLLCNELNLSYHTLHDTRHTFASLLSNAGADPDTVIKIIGHGDYQVTLETYVSKDLNKMLDVVNMI